MGPSSSKNQGSTNQGKENDVTGMEVKTANPRHGRTRRTGMFKIKTKQRDGRGGASIDIDDLRIGFCKENF